VDECARNIDEIMENSAAFDLSGALRRWLDALAQTPEIKHENLKELEVHVRDSVTQLQTKGLSTEESFLVATHRVGSPARLGPEFGKVNGRLGNLLAHGLILLFVSLACFFLWSILLLPGVMPHWIAGREGIKTILPPAFSEWVMDSRSFLVGPPLLALAYCACIVVNPRRRSTSWTGFFAASAAGLLLLALPVGIAVLLPIIEFMNRLASHSIFH